MLLTELLGREVIDADGRPAGRVSELTVNLADSRPRVSHLLIRGRRGTPVREVPWEAVTEVGPPLRLRAGTTTAQGGASSERRLLLTAHVLDRQIFDAGGMCLRRVGDVELAQVEGALRLVAVEVGIAALLRRIGLRALARRLSARVVDWDELHIASGPGHRIQLRSSAAGVHRMSPTELAALVARMPQERADEVLGAADARRVAAAKSLLAKARAHRRGPLQLRRRAPS